MEQPLVLKVQVEDWRGPAKTATYASISLNSAHASVCSGTRTADGMTWQGASGCVELLFNPEVPRGHHVLEIAIMEGDVMGDTCVAKSITRVGGYPALLNSYAVESYQPVLSCGDLQVGALRVRMGVAAAPQQPNAPHGGGGAPTAPSAPLYAGASAPPLPTSSAPPAAPPTQIAVNPYAGSLPSANPSPSAPAAPAANTGGQPYRIVGNNGGPLRYTGNAPMPPPPTGKQTPTEIWEAHVAKQAQTKQERDLGWQQKQQEQKRQKKGGFFNQLSEGLNAVVHHTSSFATDACASAERTVRDSDMDSMRSAFKKVFTNLANSEVVEAGYRCKFTNGSSQVFDGTVFITARYFAFIPSIGSPQQPPFFEEYANVLSYANVRAMGKQCLQIFTKAGYVFQFSDFVTDLKRQAGSFLGTVTYTPCEACVIYIDRRWRMCAPVPTPGYTYAPAR